jgi:hypothetical protein
MTKIANLSLASFLIANTYKFLSIANSNCGNFLLTNDLLLKQGVKQKMKKASLAASISLLIWLYQAQNVSCDFGSEMRAHNKEAYATCGTCAHSVMYGL